MADETRPIPQPQSDPQHLDRSDPTFDAWRTPREDLQAGRRKGLTDPHYLAPQALDHGQD